MQTVVRVTLPVLGQLENKYAEYYFTLIRACFPTVVRVIFLLSVISHTFLGFHDYTAFHSHSLTWRSLLEDRTTFNLLSQLERD